MPAHFDAVRRGRVFAAAGLLTSVVLVLTACGGEDETGAITDSDSGPPPTEQMDTPSPTMTDEGETADDDAAAEQDETDNADEPAPGAYRDYSEEALAEPGYETNVIFFHASWCPECRAFEQSIEAGPIPDGVQILKADYDTETDLKKKYDVRIQTTFVKVDKDGEMISSWIGYEQDRSIDNLLNQLG
jgi:thiol-disulfide isomerase/thioredoxin